jgi:hypothetical protein
MTPQTMSLMDILTPPGNPWLASLARRKTDLPAGVRIVRFGEGDDDTGLESASGETETTPARKK